MQQVASGADCI